MKDAILAASLMACACAANGCEQPASPSVVFPTTLTLTWGGLLTSERLPASEEGRSSIVSHLNGWLGDYEFEAHGSGELTLELETACAVGGTYTDFQFTVRNAIDDRVGAVFAYGPGVGGGSLLYRYVQTIPLEPGVFRVKGALTGYIGGPCEWSLVLTRPV